MDAKPFYGLLDFPAASPRLRGLAADFAREAHAGWPGIADIYPLPVALWERAGKAGVTGVGIDAAFGGQGGGYEDICACAADISFWSQSPGLGLCLFIHQLTARFSIGALASPGQKEEYLPQLAAGSLTAAHAISEQETGGNPKHMKTGAERSGGGWVLNGDKTFVTNGPIAGLFITLAATGEKEEKREFSAFLVPASAKGVQVRDVGPLSFLRPAPHGAVRFDGVQLPEHSLLGEEGKALEFLSRGFAALEDVLMPGILAGGFAALLMRLCKEAAQAGQNTPEKQKLAGRLQAGLTGFAALASHGSGRTGSSGFLQKSQNLGRAAREVALFNLSLFRELARGIPLAHDTEVLFTDLEKSLTIRGKLADTRAEKAGKALLSV